MRKTLILAIIVTSLGILGLFLVWSNQPSQGTKIASNDADEEVRGTSTSLETFSTDIFNTKITSNLKIKTKTELPNTPIPGQYLFVDKNPYTTDQLAITIGIADGNSVNDVSPVQFRKTLAQEYQVTKPESGFPADAIMFTKKAGYEKSVFWVYGGFYAGVVVSGGADRSAALDETLRATVTQWIFTSKSAQ